MDSRLTLVQPSFSTHPADVWIFTPDDAKNTTISQHASGKPLFIVTSNAHLTQTAIARAAAPDTPLAVLARREILPDKITFAGEKSRSVKTWLKSPKTSIFPVTFEEGGRVYTWRSSIVHQLSLVADGAPETPIAWFEPAKKRVIDGMSTITVAFLALQPEALAIQDAVLVSFVILLHKSRMDVKSIQLVEGRAWAG